MKKAHDDQLCREFPLLYRERYSHRNPMHYGFTCGDGWFEIIYDLSKQLEPLIAAMPEDERPAAAQVKEKFGTLRFYMTTETEEMTDLIIVAENDSAVTCEECGKDGRLREGGWLLTLCLKHHFMRKIERKLRDLKWSLEAFLDRLKRKRR